MAGKYSKERKKKLSAEQVNEIKEKMKLRETNVSSPTSQTGHLVEIKTAWNALIKKANITNFRVHDLRHTLATYLIANGADAFMVKRALTHKSLQSTQVYVNLGVEHLRDKLNDTVEKMIKISKE